MRATRLLKVGLLIALFALCSGAAWSGGGDGRGRWIEGSEDRILSDAAVKVALVARADQRARILITVELPGARGDGVLDLALTGATHTFPSELVDLVYVEYNADGDVAFHAEAARAGHVRLTGATFEMDLELWDSRAGAGSWRRIHDLLVPIEGEALVAVDHYGHDHAESSVELHGGARSSGCEGDDSWGGESEPHYEDTNSGCEGDDVGDSSSGSTGCGGDDVGSSGGCDGSCTGDAVAADHSHNPRHAWLVKLIRWMPFLLVLAFVRLLRRIARAKE